MPETRGLALLKSLGDCVFMSQLLASPGIPCLWLLDSSLRGLLSEHSLVAHGVHLDNLVSTFSLEVYSNHIFSLNKVIVVGSGAQGGSS